MLRANYVGTAFCRDPTYLFKVIIAAKSRSENVFQVKDLARKGLLRAQSINPIAIFWLYIKKLK